MRHRFILAATMSVVLAASSILLLAGSVSAHAYIGKVEWNNSANPTQVIATSVEDNISTVAGSFYLRVYNDAGQQVDLGDTKVSPNDGYQMMVSVKPNLPAGDYRVEWKTVSADDGDTASANLTLQLFAQPTPAPATPTRAPAAVVAAPATAPVSVAPPATGDAGLARVHEGTSRSFLFLAIVGFVATGSLILVRRSS